MISYNTNYVLDYVNKLEIYIFINAKLTTSYIVGKRWWDSYGLKLNQYHRTQQVFSFPKFHLGVLLVCFKIFSYFYFFQVNSLIDSLPHVCVSIL
jgi:hypothetical protein